MKLTQLFTGETHIEESGRTPQTKTATTADVNRQIQSLVPGQTIRGEILSRNGSDVQIRISDDMVLNARVDQSIHLEMGKNLTFEVKNNGSKLSLSPLFTNVSTDVNILKALDMAGLPVNETSVVMTKQLMEAGLPVNRSYLQQVYREINSFPDGEISDVVNLHKLQMPVNEGNMQQMASYRNLTHQLISGITSVLDALPEAVVSMLAEGNTEGVAELYKELFGMLQEGEELPVGVEQGDMSAEAEASVAGAIQEGRSAVTGEGIDQLPLPGSAEGNPTGEAVVDIPGAEQAEAAGPLREGAVIPAESREALADEMLQVLGDVELSPQESSIFAENIQRFGQGELSAAELFQTAEKLVEAARHNGSNLQAVQKMFTGKEFQKLLSQQLKNQWSLRPQEVSQPGKVEEFYRRLDRQLKGLTQTLEMAGQEGSAAYKAASSLSQNVDFLHQMNQMYTYVQLPLQLRQSEAHGDLYVYTNKRSLAENDGKVSALLHLDMEHLGSLDVYVTLQESKVNTKFYVADEEILDFIGAHMDILTQRLQKRGYDCSFSMTTRGEKEAENKEGALAPLLQQEKGILLSQYAFDVRT